MRIPLTRLLLPLGASAASMLFMSCAGSNSNFPYKGPHSIHKAERVLYQWHDNKETATGPVKVNIDLTEQKAHILKGGEEVGWCYVATGKEGHGTPAGSYSITEKIVDKYSNKYGWIEDDMGNVVDGDASPGDRVPPGCKYVPAPMPYWMRLTSYGIGMHVGIIPEPGKPASHGCIRMPEDFVPDMFEMVKVGTPVKITY